MSPEEQMSAQISSKLLHFLKGENSTILCAAARRPATIAFKGDAASERKKHPPLRANKSLLPTFVQETSGICQILHETFWLMILDLNYSDHTDISTSVGRETFQKKFGNETELFLSMFPVGTSIITAVVAVEAL